MWIEGPLKTGARLGSKGDGAEETVEEVDEGPTLMTMSVKSVSGRKRTVRRGNGRGR